MTPTRQQTYADKNRAAINARARAAGLKPWQKLNKRDRYKMARTGSEEFRQTLEKRCEARRRAVSDGWKVGEDVDVDVICVGHRDERYIAIEMPVAAAREERERPLWESPRSEYV